MKHPRLLIPFSVVFLLGLLCAGCACTRDHNASSGSPVPPGGPGAALSRNLSDVEFLIEDVEMRSETEYLLRGKILSAVPAGSMTGIAEAGQTLSLALTVPAEDAGSHGGAGRPGFRPGPDSEGKTIRCRVTLGSDGTWRIVSVD